MAIQTSSKLGVDFNNATDTAQFTSGDTCSGNQDSLWVYMECNGAVTTGDCCTLTTSGTGTRVTTTGGQAAGQGLMAFPQTSATSGQFVWACQRGNNVYVNVSATCNPSAVLYIATTSGKLSTTSASSTLAGVMLLAATTTATNAPALANLSWPRFVTNFG